MAMSMVDFGLQLGAGLGKDAERMGAALGETLEPKATGCIKCESAHSCWEVTRPALPSVMAYARARGGEDDQERSGATGQRERNGLGRTRARGLSRTMSYAHNTRTVGCEMDARAKIARWRLDLRSNGRKGGPIGPLIRTARSEIDGDTQQPHDPDPRAGAWWALFTRERPNRHGPSDGEPTADEV